MIEIEQSTKHSFFKRLRNIYIKKNQYPYIYNDKITIKRKKKKITLNYSITVCCDNLENILDKKICLNRFHFLKMSVFRSMKMLIFFL